MHLIHRGIVNKKYKENLLKSFNQSFKKGYGIETDIHATKDNEFVCFHDFTLKRTFKKNLSIKNLNYTKIREISAKFKKPVPLLKELLESSKNKFSLFIEIKPTFSKPFVLSKKVSGKIQFTKGYFKGDEMTLSDLKGETNPRTKLSRVNRLDEMMFVANAMNYVFKVIQSEVKDNLL